MLFCFCHRPASSHLSCCCIWHAELCYQACTDAMCMLVIAVWLLPSVLSCLQLPLIS
jgi:hypothetical protein